MYHLNITEAFKKYTKKHSLQKNVNQEDLIKTLDTLTEQLKPSFLKSVTSIFSSKKPKGFYLYGAYRDWETDRKSTRLNSSHSRASRMPSSA